MISVCFHGAESTGKSALAERLHAELGVPWVAEYGRHYAETHGTDFTMADLLAIAAGQDAAMRAAAMTNPPLLILDTDPLMTAAWAQMLFGKAPDGLFGYAKADLYLLFSADTPWVADGIRFFGTEQLRAKFAAVCEAVLVRAGVRWSTISGSWNDRHDGVMRILDTLAANRP